MLLHRSMAHTDIAAGGMCVFPMKELALGKRESMSFG